MQELDGPRPRRAQYLRSCERTDHANVRMPKLRRDDHKANTAAMMTVSEFGRRWPFRRTSPRADDTGGLPRRMHRVAPAGARLSAGFHLSTRSHRPRRGAAQHGAGAQRPVDRNHRRHDHRQRTAGDRRGGLRLVRPFASRVHRGRAAVRTRCHSTCVEAVPCPHSQADEQSSSSTVIVATSGPSLPAAEN